MTSFSVWIDGKWMKEVALVQCGDSFWGYQSKICVGKVDKPQKRIMDEAHISIYIINLGSMKMNSYWSFSGTTDLYTEFGQIERAKI